VHTTPGVQDASDKPWVSTRSTTITGQKTLRQMVQVGLLVKVKRGALRRVGLMAVQ
jgi:hypothetical protein